MLNQGMTPNGFQRLLLDENAPLALSQGSGVSFLIDDKTGLRVRKLPSGGNPTIGFGLNLGVRPLQYSVCLGIAQLIIKSLWADLIINDPWLTNIPPTWADVAIMIEFIVGDVQAFPKMLAAMENGDVAGVVANIQNSTAYREETARWQRFCDAVTKNAWDLGA